MTLSPAGIRKSPKQVALPGSTRAWWLSGPAACQEAGPPLGAMRPSGAVPRATGTARGLGFTRYTRAASTALTTYRTRTGISLSMASKTSCSQERRHPRGGSTRRTWWRCGWLLGPGVTRRTTSGRRTPGDDREFGREWVEGPPRHVAEDGAPPVPVNRRGRFLRGAPTGSTSGRAGPPCACRRPGPKAPAQTPRPGRQP
jgi:hypothetical protein